MVLERGEEVHPVDSGSETPGCTTIRMEEMAMTVLESFSLTGRTALVTGATRGLGRAFARGLAEAGADVVIHGRDADAAEEVRSEIASLGRVAHVVLGELTSREGVDQVVEEAAARAHNIDILVNNAGACVHQPALEVTDDEWDQVLDTNVTALWRMSQGWADTWWSEGGSIVNIGSIQGSSSTDRRCNRPTTPRRRPCTS